LRGLLRAIILLFVRLYGAPRARKAARHARAIPGGEARILLLRPDHLGDLVLTTPVLHALRQRLPGAHITLAVGPWSSEIVARNPDLDRLMTFPFPGFTRVSQRALAPYMLLFGAAQQLRRADYDLAINLRPDFWWGAALLYLAAIPRRIGYALSPGAPLLTKALPFHTPELATVSSLRLASAALQSLGREPLPEPFTPRDYPLDFHPTGEEQRQVAERLANAGIDESTPLIVIHPGTGAAVKLWRAAGWAFCASALPSRLTFPTPARIILTGSRNERPLLEEIARDMQEAPLILTDLTIGQLAALLGRATLALGVDNGPMHIAVAQDTPTLALFGPTDPRIYGPWGSPERHRVLASTYRCPTCPAIPCGRLDISPRDLPAHPCVRKLTDQDVLTTAETLLMHIDY
jgi:ADP-heptose:LPS heptosyltransferase